MIKLLSVLAVLAVHCFAQQDATVSNFKVGVLNKGAEPSGLKTVQLFSKSSEVFKVSSSDRFYVSFAVTSKGSDAKLKPHQVFVILEHSITKADIVFVADAQKDGSYVTDIDLNKVWGDFDGQSGTYRARLVIGDFKIKTPIDWHFADAEISVPASVVAPVKKSEQVVVEPLPEIVHQFREPEKRPPGFISDAFTLLCLSPLLILVILWLAIGVNFSRMPLSPWTLIFHASLAGVFGLYFVFWVKLNMFETLKYLAMIAGVTFVSGNRLFRILAQRRNKEKTA